MDYYSAAKMRLRRLNVQLGLAGCLIAVMFTLYFHTIVFGVALLFGLSIFLCFADLLLVKPTSGRRTNLQKTFFGVIFVGMLSFFWLEAQVIQHMDNNDAPITTKYAIVLGAAVKDDRPTYMLQLRLDKAVEFLTAAPNCNVIVSGGQGPLESDSEAEIMKRYLIEQGIAANRIIKEDRSTTTDENLRYSKEVIKQQFGKELSSILIITSDFHMYRAKQLARRYYDKVYGLPAETPAAVKTLYMIREYFAYIKLLMLSAPIMK